MKQLTFATILVLASLLGNSQMYMGISGGVSSVKSKTFVTIGAGYKTQYCVGAELEMRVVLTNYTGDKGEVPANPAHLGGKLFVSLTPFKDFHILPQTGYYFRMVSADDPSLNGFDFLLGGRVIYKFISLEYANIGKYNQYSAGIIVSFNKN